jgi:hypothetical protein
MFLGRYGEVKYVGKSTNGPEWTDVAMMMEALSVLHECHVGCLVTTDGQGHNGRLHISLIAQFDVLPGSAMPEKVIADSHWPNADARDLAAWVYGGLYALDFKIGEAYQQRFLPGVE